MTDVSDSESFSESGSEESSSREMQPIIFTKDYDLHALKMPTKERVMKDVAVPAAEPLSDSDFWTAENVPNVVNIKAHLTAEGRLSKTQIHKIIDLAYEVYCAEETVLNVPAPVTVCGDTHGQFYDLLKLFQVGGDPSDTTYLFLGDYVDRGYFSIEVCVLMFCYKILYPSTFFMLRGNHECRHLTDYFTFKEEVEFKYDLEVYDDVMDCFDALPLAAVMNKQFLCVHGGLSPELQTVDDINRIDRFTEPPPSGLMCDLLWADPMEDFSPEIEELYEFNTVRGCSSVFSFRAACKFLDENKLLSVIRAHEAQDAGYRMHRKNDKTGFPSVITLFSAPNYLDNYNNKGAVLRYENNVINIRQFNHSAHPYHLPQFLNVFAWSLPFVVEKVAELLLVFLNLVDDEQADEAEAVAANEEDAKAKKRAAMRNKIKGVSKMLRMFKTLRQEREEVLALGAISPSGEHAPSTVGKEVDTNKLKSSLATFDGVKSLDLGNEKRPAGIDKALTSAKNQASTPSGIQRRSSRDSIIRRTSKGSINVNMKDAVPAPRTSD
eukprot:TRINITY_DN124_c1_g1_i1.p1 TRINITY_DN124_c1_g1~~TRINITY_DN124_c1_g1_i1.p1  ORF type:complete len:550 (-),score=149.36 TRINITY_DN124_c1_g1_i1:174-1823(-)